MDKTDDEVLKGLDASSKPDTKAQQDNGQVKDAWKEVVGDKYKTPEELAKGYKELEKKVGEQGEKVRQSEEFAATISPLLEEIRQDPEIFKKLDERLRKKANPDKSDAKGDEKKPAEDIRGVTSDLVVARFEEKYGIDKLPTDEAKAMRKSIGAVLSRVTGQTINQIDLRRLGSVLEDSYVVANKGKLIEKSKLEALASAQEADNASIGSISSKTGKAEETLNSEEATVAERLGLTREQYLGGKKGSANVKKR